MMATERKYDDESDIRFTKDDAKQQTITERRGTKEPMVSIREEVTQAQAKQANTNASLAPVIQPSALVKEKGKLHHVEPPKEEADAPIPSQLELPGEIGEKAAEGWDAIMEHSHSMLDTAKEKVHDLKEKTTNAIGLVQRKGAEKMHDLQAKKRGAAAKEKKQSQHQEAESIQQRLVRYRNKLIEVWQGEEPIVKERVHQGVALAKKYKLEVPLLALATLLVLWASVSFIGWLAFPSTPAHGIVESARPQEFHTQPHFDGLHPGLTGKAWEQHEAATGPLQDVPGPTLVDRLKMKLNNIESKVAHSLETIKLHGTDKLAHLKEAVPTPAVPDLHVADRVGHLKDAVRNTVPTVEEIKEKIPTMGDVKEGVQNLKDKVTGGGVGVSDKPDNLRSGVDEFHADMGQTPADLEGMPTHQHAAAHPEHQHQGHPLQAQAQQPTVVPAHDHILPGGRVEHVPQHQHN